MTSARGEFTSTIIPGMPFPGKRIVAVAAGLVIAVVVLAMPYVRTAAFLMDLAGLEGGVRAWIPIDPVPVTSRDHQAPTRHGPMPIRVYEPVSPAPPTVVVFPGVHGGGIDAPRLTQLCQRLSSSGLRVVCAPLPDLRRFVITGRSTDMIEDVTAWVSHDPALAPSSRVTLVGVSFAGGLAIVAAGRDSLRDRLNAVVSIGGHGDLTRTLRFLISGVLPDGSPRTPHDYPLAIVELTLAPRLVPADQVTRLEDTIRTFLQASLDNGSGFAHGIPTIERLKADLVTLPEPTRTLARAVVERDVATTGRALAPWLGELGADAALSPSLAPLPEAPVFLLHGADDNVIPSTETPLLVEDFAARSQARVRWLLTPLVTHAHLNTNAGPRELWELMRFWRDVRRAVER
jgi:dienelactone hydrolase